MFEVQAPYMTVYDASRIQCSCHRILKDLYYAWGHPRTAQAFLCCGPGDIPVDMMTVHAPSSTKTKLTDQQRPKLITNLLQSNSKSMPGCTIGSARFLIGGDMNTPPLLLSGILQTCRENHVLHTQEQIMEPLFAKHGDVCFQGGFTATCLSATAKNHDPQHVPYGVCWAMPQGSATEQPLPLGSAKAKSATPQRAASSSTKWVKPPPPMRAPPTPAAMPAPSMSARVELEDLQSRAEQVVICESGIEQELEGMHAKYGNILKPEDFEQAPDEETAAAATEHSEEATRKKTE